ncbi:Phosphoenolpyruvate synthase [Actinokineospora sp. UTMC 2448]|nr:Phosphoenolpyruvate synthase [Actinokineospora sp. UTMC 2448]
MLSGIPYVKLVIDKVTNSIHFLDEAAHLLHVQYIAKHILDLPPGEIERILDAFNHSVMRAPDRRFYLATLGRYERGGSPFYALETTEVDTMSADMARDLYERVRRSIVGPPVFFKPANHLQERFVALIPPDELPRVHATELYASSPFVPLRPGRAHGRLRAFGSEAEYRAAEPLRWFDIVVMDRVPEDIPRVSGILNSAHTTPLSHTNILARGWDIPNAVQLGVLDTIARDGLDGAWVVYEVDPAQPSVRLSRGEPLPVDAGPPRRAVVVPVADTAHDEIAPLDRIGIADAVRYGTKAAHLGEVARVLRDGSDRLLGYYERPRPPRPNLLAHLARLLDEPRPDALADAANRLLRETLSVPPGIALPFGTADTDDLGARVAAALARHVGPGPYAVRSSSDAEDLPGFSAAGIYESLTGVAAEDVPAAIARVRASLRSPRATRLRREAGIADAHMAVIVQRQVHGDLGGVMVTANPVQPADIRGVFLNISPRSVEDVVSGAALPIEHVYNTMEGGGRTLSLGAFQSDVDDAVKPLLARLALAGRLLQAHFADGDQPVDVEWVAADGRVHLVQIRPFGG